MQEAEETAILYGTDACHLCEHAAALLQELATRGLPLRWDDVDISEDDALFQRYGLRIPVLRLASGQELDWPFDETGVAAALQETG